MDIIKVLIADDHSMVRQGLKQLIELEEDIKVIAEAADGKEALSKAIVNDFDLILMDINMPFMNGIEAIKAILKEKPDSKIIVLTIHQDKSYLTKALKSGAKGYVLKDADYKILIEAIRTVNKNQKYIQPNLAGELLTEDMNSLERSSKKNKLTKREMDILEYITKGMINKEIAYELKISEKTVKNHVSSILKKLDVYDRTQAAIYAYKNNLV